MTGAWRWGLGAAVVVAASIAALTCGRTQAPSDLAASSSDAARGAASHGILGSSAAVPSAADSGLRAGAADSAPPSTGHAAGAWGVAYVPARASRPSSP